jgi:tRNA(Ile)-lysidine synthetase-like protein
MKKKNTKLIDLVNKTHEVITKQNLIKPKQLILITISGGQDSICLFFILLQLKRQWKWNFGVLYCNHFWQINAFYTSSLILNLSFLFLIPTYLNLPSDNIFSEQKSRNWRYYQFKRLSFFYRYEIITTAHTATDRIETTFFQLIRGTGTGGLSLLNWKRSIENFSYTKPKLHFEKKIFVLYFCNILLYEFQTHFQTFYCTQICVLLHEDKALLNTLSNTKISSFTISEKSLELGFYFILRNSSSHLNYFWKKTKHHLLSSNSIWIYDEFISLTAENLHILKNDTGVHSSSNLFLQNKQNRHFFWKKKSRYKKTRLLKKKNSQLNSRAIMSNFINRYNPKRIKPLLTSKIRGEILTHFFLFKFSFSILLKLPKKIYSNFHLSFFKVLVYFPILNPIPLFFWPRETLKGLNLFNAVSYMRLPHLPLRKKSCHLQSNKRKTFITFSKNSRDCFVQPNLVNKQNLVNLDASLFLKKEGNLLIFVFNKKKPVFLTFKPSKILIKFMTVSYWSTFKSKFSKKDILDFDMRDTFLDELNNKKKKITENNFFKKKLFFSVKKSSYFQKNRCLMTNFYNLSNTQKIKIINVIFRNPFKKFTEVILETLTWNLQTWNKQNLIDNRITNTAFFYSPLVNLDEKFYPSLNIFLYALFQVFKEHQVCSSKTSKIWTKQSFVKVVKLARSTNFTGAVILPDTVRTNKSFLKKRKFDALFGSQKTLDKSFQEVKFQTSDNQVKFDMKYSIFFNYLSKLTLYQPYCCKVIKKPFSLEKANESIFSLKKNSYQKKPFKQVNQIQRSTNSSLYFFSKQVFKNILYEKLNLLKKSKVCINFSFPSVRRTPDLFYQNKLFLTKKLNFNFYQNKRQNLNNKRSFLLQTCNLNSISSWDVDYALTYNTFSLILVQQKCKSTKNPDSKSNPKNFVISKNILVSLNKVNRKNIFLIRPLLFVNRFDLRKLCTFWQLPIYPDKTNENLSYYRNRIRKQLLPLLRFFFNPQIDKIFLQFSELANSEEIYFNFVATRLKQEFQIKKEKIFLNLQTSPFSERKNLIFERELERYQTYYEKTTQLKLKNNCFLNKIQSTPSLFFQNNKLVKHKIDDFKTKIRKFELLLQSINQIPNHNQFFIAGNEQNNSDFSRKQLNLSFFNFFPIAIRRRILKQFLNYYFPEKIKFFHIEILLQEIFKIQTNQFPSVLRTPGLFYQNKYFYTKLPSIHNSICRKNLQDYQKLNFKQLLVSVSNTSKKQSLNENYWLRASLFSTLAENSIKKTKNNFSVYYFKKCVYTKLKPNSKHQKCFSSSNQFEQFQLFFFPGIGVFLILSNQLVGMPKTILRFAI